MSSVTKVVLRVLAGVVTVAALILLSWVFLFNGLAMQKVAVPTQIQIQTDAFKNSQAYNEGVAQDLLKMQLNYIQTKDQDEKNMIRGLILRRIAGYDTSKLDADTQMFIDKLRSGL